MNKLVGNRMNIGSAGGGCLLEGSGADAAGAALALESVGAIPASLRIAETSLSRAYRLRLSILGLAIALLALVICIAVGLLIAGGPFHTSLGSLV